MKYLILVLSHPNTITHIVFLSSLFPISSIHTKSPSLFLLRISLIFSLLWALSHIEPQPPHLYSSPDHRFLFETNIKGNDNGNGILGNGDDLGLSLGLSYEFFINGLILGFPLIGLCWFLIWFFIDIGFDFGLILWFDFRVI